VIDRATVLAVGLSLVAHLLLLGGLELRVATPVQPELPEPFMQAQLITPPPPPPAPVAEKAAEPAAPAAAPRPGPKPVPKANPKPKPKPAPAPAPATEVGVSEAPLQMAMASPPSEASPSAADADAAALAVTAPLAAAVDDGFRTEGWPRRGSIVFRVFMGDPGFEVGEARHAWSHDEAHYTMELELRTTGVAALMNRFRYTQRSEGEVGAKGLKPQRFSVEQRGRASDVVEFDWQAAQATIRRGGRKPRTARIVPGDQDVLSLWHQVGLVGARGLPANLTVLTNKSAKPASLKVMGPESADLPIGRLDTLRLRAEAGDGSLTVDIWLASRYGMLPVRIRIVDDEGEVLDQRAIQLRLTPVEEAAGLARAGTPAAAEADVAADMIELKEAIDPAVDLYR
jgi:hypothetical protein